MTPFALFALFGVVAIAIASVQYYLRRKRREELAVVARRLGLEFSAEDVWGCLAYPFELLRKGDGRGTENVLSGTWEGIPLRAFDYWYYEKSTDAQGHTSRSYHRLSCAVTEVDAVCAPIAIRREGFFSWIADHIGLRDIQFELDAFNEAFNVTCEDRKFAFDLVDQRMMRFLLENDPDLGFEASGRWLLCVGPKRPPMDLVPLFGALRGFRDHVPKVVFDLYAPGGTG